MLRTTLAGLLLIVSMQAQAALFGFDCITDNSGSCDSVASLLSLDITASGSDTLFTFAVAEGANLAVKSIYFDDADGLLTDANPITFGYSDANEVSFQTITDGGNLPAGNSIGFVTTSSTDAEPPAGDDKYGIDNGEWFSILFGGVGSGDILSAISLGDFDIGMHIGSIGDAGQYSEAVSLGVSAVPLPASIWLFGTGLIAFVGFSRRRKI